MKQFFDTIKQTFYSKELYQRAQVESGWKGVKFLSKVVLLIGIVMGAIAVVLLVAFTPMLKGKVIEFAQSTYPEGLVVTFADGIMTTNSEVPVIIPLPPAWANEDERRAQDTPTNLLVLAPNDDASLENLQAYDTLAIAGKRALMAGVGGDFRTYVYSRDPQMITKESFLSTVDTVLRVGTTAAYLMIIPMMIVVGITFAIWHLLWLLVVALVLWLVYKVRHQDRTYKQVYKMGIYALVPVLLIDIVTIPLGISGKVVTAAIVIIIVLMATRQTRGEVAENS